MALFMLALPCIVCAQWETHTLTLQPGWNAVQLLVQPTQDLCEVIFSNTAVDQVQWWRREGIGPQFELSPAELFPRSADFNQWYATNAGLSTFFSLQAGESYEILQTSSVAIDVPIKGRVVLNPFYWVPSTPSNAGQNLVGLPVPPAGNEVSFQRFFSYSPNFEVNSSTATVFSVDAAGNPQQVFNPALVGINRGEAYWITAGENAHRYEGPIRVSTTSGRRILDYGSMMTPQTIVIENVSSTNRFVQVRHLASGTPPAGAPPLIDRVPLIYAEGALGTVYNPLPETNVLNLAAGARFELKLAPDPQRLTNGVPGSAWQSILRITDEDNDELSGPAVDVRIGVACDGELSGLQTPTGLWAGSVKVTKVSRAQTREGVEPSEWSSTNPVPVSMPYEFRVIFHVDAVGGVLLLQRILVARDAGGTNALLTSEGKAATYRQLNPDAKITRISSANLPVMAPIAASGMFGISNRMNFEIQVPYDDPVNPFVHRYHPKHDNLEYVNDVPMKLGEGAESYTVSRSQWFEFTGADPETGKVGSGWGFTENGGFFREQVHGLNKTICVEGIFRVERISTVGSLE